MSAASGARFALSFQWGSRLSWLFYTSFLALLIAAYVSVFARGVDVGVDYACFRAAASVLGHGGNPYDAAQLWSAEQAYYGIALNTRAGLAAYNVVDQFYNPPLFASALRPLASLPFATGYVLYSTGVVALAALGAWLTLSALGWTRRRLSAIGIAIVTPSVFLAVWNGQPSTLLLCAVGGAMYALRRRRPGIAGMLMALGWVKPHLLVPIALATPLLLTPRAARRCYFGFAAATAVGVALTAMTSGTLSIIEWLRTLFGYTGYVHMTGVTSVDVIQNYLPSLSGAGLILLPSPWNRGVTGAVTLLALVAIVLLTLRWRQRRSPWEAVSVLMAAWLLAAPYVHPHDEVLLLPALAVAWGRNGEKPGMLRWTTLWAMSTLTLAFMLPRPWSLLGIVPAALVVIAAIRAPDSAPGLA